MEHSAAMLSTHWRCSTAVTHALRCVTPHSAGAQQAGLRRRLCGRVQQRAGGGRAQRAGRRRRRRRRGQQPERVGHHGAHRLQLRGPPREPPGARVYGEPPVLPQGKRCLPPPARERCSSGPAAGTHLRACLGPPAALGLPPATRRAGHRDSGVGAARRLAAGGGRRRGQPVLHRPSHDGRQQRWVGVGRGAPASCSLACRSTQRNS